MATRDLSPAGASGSRDWIAHGSPLNVLDTGPFERNAERLRGGRSGGSIQSIDLSIYFARKANKALAFVDEAKRLGLGVDVASEGELRQRL